MSLFRPSRMACIRSNSRLNSEEAVPIPAAGFPLLFCFGSGTLFFSPCMFVEGFFLTFLELWLRHDD